jgi:hypothetical protein
MQHPRRITFQRKTIVHRGENGTRDLFTAPREFAHVTRKRLNFIEFSKTDPAGAQELMGSCGAHNSATKSLPCDKLQHLNFLRRLTMLGQIARWGHNVLLTTMGLLTIAMVVSAR